MKALIRAGVAALLLGPPSGIAQAEPGPDSLYVRIGGEPELHAIVTDFAARLYADSEIAPFYKGVTRSKFTLHLQQQLCVLSGGGCVYEGEGMREVHAGLKIQQAQFYRLVEILRSTLKDEHVALRERNEMLALLAPMKRDVIDQQ
jgi:hemoglobin